MMNNYNNPKTGLSGVYAMYKREDNKKTLKEVKNDYSWPLNPKYINVKLIGTVMGNEEVVRVVCASFHALIIIKKL